MYSTQLDNFTDADLLVKYKQTDDNAIIGVLFQRYTFLIMGVCMKYLKDEYKGQDACMHIFEKLLVDLRKYDIQEFKPWLYMVCKNYCLMQLRSEKSQEKREKALHKDFSINVMEFKDDSHLIENKKELELTFMEECIKDLVKEQKMCIELFFLQEKSYQEVALLTNFSMNHVKSYLQNGKRNLKNCIEIKMRYTESS